MNRPDKKERVLECAHFFINNNSTVRDTSKHFSVGKSQIHLDLTTKLPQYDKDLYYKVKQLLNKNKSERHIRGGLATKNKYKKLKESS